MEALLSLPLLFMSGVVIVTILYRGMLYFVADYQLHEALICCEDQATYSCEQELKSRLRPLLITKPSFQVRLHKTDSAFTGTISIELKPALILEKKWRP